VAEERDLSLRIQADGSQAKQELTDVKGKVDDVTGGEKNLGGAVDTTTAAVKGQAPSLDQLKDMFARAKMSGADLAAQEAGLATTTASATEAFTLFGLSGGPLTLALVGIVLALTNANEAGTFLGETYNKLTGAVDGEAKALTENEKAVIKADQAQKNFNDTKAQQIRIQDAINAGLMTDTGNAQLNAAVYALLHARLTGMVEVTDEYVKKARELGITVPESFTRVRASAEGLQEGYSRAMKVSVADGQAFAEANEKLLNTVIVRFTEAGQKVPPELIKIKKALDDSRGSVEELTKAIDKHKEKLTELDAKLAEHSKKLAEDAAAIEKRRKTQEAAADAEYQAVRHGLDEELVALEASRRAGLVTEEHYRSEFARIQNEQHDERRKWETEVAAIDAAAAQRVADAQRKDDEKTAKIKANRDEEITAETKLDLERERIRQRDVARAIERQIADDAALDRLGKFNDKAALMAKFRETEAQNVVSGFEDIALALDGVIAKVDLFLQKLRLIDVGGAAGGTGGGGAGGF
jgi:hypothetical protein